MGQPRGAEQGSAQEQDPARERGSTPESADRRSTRGARLSRGDHGERLAEALLTRRGARVLDRNWRARPTAHGVRGELDLVVSWDGQLVGVEVKTRRGTAYGHPFEAVDAARLHRLHLLLAAWAREHGMAAAPRRVDVVAVLLSPAAGEERVRLEHRAGLH